MSTDYDEVTARFDRFRATTTITAPGGPEARALAKHHRHQQWAALAAVLLVLAGVSALVISQGRQPDRLTPATTAPTPTPPAGWQETVLNAHIDLRPAKEGNCSGPDLQFRDGKAVGVERGGGLMNYTIESRFPMRAADFDRDGRVDYLVSIGCGSAHPPKCTYSKDICDQWPDDVVIQLFVLRGTPDDLTTVGGIRGITGIADPSELHVTIRPDSLIRIEDDADPGYVLIWGYRNGHMEVIKRWVTVTPSASPTK